MTGGLLALLLGGAVAGLPIGAGPDSWSVTASEGVTARVLGVPSAPPRAVRLDFDFRGTAGRAGLRTPLPADLPGNWELSLLLKGEGPPNALEVRLLDASGKTVRTWRRKAAPFPPDWDRLVVMKRQLSSPGGSAAGGGPERFRVLELAVTPGEGGRGALLVADVLIDGKPEVPESAGPPGLAASSSAPEHPPAAAMDGDLGTFWESGASGEQTISMDFGAPRAFGGLAVTWESGLSARAFVVEASDDGALWRILRRAGEAAAETSWLRLPGTEARHLRLRLLDGDGPAYGIREIAVLPFEVSESPGALYAAMAREARRGLFPRAIRGEQVSWTVAGVDGGGDDALLSEDGEMEPGTGSFSVEPFVRVAGRLVTWADVVSEASLMDGSLPIPTVTWTAPEISLQVTAVADGSPGSPRLLARYRLRNRTGRKLVATLALAVRPLLVEPPAQGAGASEGVAPIRTLAWDGRALLVNGSRPVVPLRAPASFNATSFAAGDVVSFLEAGRVPPGTGVEDASGLASGTFAFPLALEAGGESDVVLEIPMTAVAAPQGSASADGGAAIFGKRLEAAAEAWREKLGRVSFLLPKEAEPLLRLLRSSLAFALAERSGPALRRGSRAEARSRIRDGASIATALLRLGHADEVRDFLLWYAPRQLENGRIPCGIDARGADPELEIGCDRAFLNLAAEYLRFTGDRATLGALRPRLARTMEAAGISFRPASPDLSDFDRAATAILPDPLDDASRVPAQALVRLGRREESVESLASLRQGLRPEGWNQWAGEAGRDMPDVTAAANFVNSFLDLFAYTSETDDALVLGAGIPEAWLSGGGTVGVRNLRTPFGTLGLSMRDVEGVLRVEITGGLRAPSGGLLLRPPGGPFRSASVNGKDVPVSAGGVAVREVPAAVLLRR